MPSSTDTSLSDSIQVPGVPGNGDKPTLYVLYFRQGRNPHPMVKYFFFKGNIKEAMTRTQNHCETMGVKFLRVEPFLSNLDAEEKAYQGSQL